MCRLKKTHQEICRWSTRNIRLHFQHSSHLRPNHPHEQCDCEVISEITQQNAEWSERQSEFVIVTHLKTLAHIWFRAFSTVAWARYESYPFFKLPLFASWKAWLIRDNNDTQSTRIILCWNCFTKRILWCPYGEIAKFSNRPSSLQKMSVGMISTWSFPLIQFPLIALIEREKDV